MKQTQNHSIKTCNGLLQGELAAMEAYERVIDTNISGSEVSELRRIHEAHSRSTLWLSGLIRSMKGAPVAGSGDLGPFSALSRHLGDPDLEASIDSLRKGEEITRNRYQRALLDDELSAECRMTIRDNLLPRVIDDISTLEKLGKTHCLAIR